MLLGQAPGSFRPSPSITSGVPLYADLVRQFLTRFGPYRLQHYAPPPPLSFIPAPPPVAPPVAAGLSPRNAGHWPRRAGDSGEMYRRPPGSARGGRDPATGSRSARQGNSQGRSAGAPRRSDKRTGV